MPGQAMRNSKIYKVRFELPVCMSVSPVHSLEDGACHKLFDDALPGPRAASLWVRVQRVGPKVSRMIIE